MLGPARVPFRLDVPTGYFRLKDASRVQYTIFDTPVVSFLLRRTASLFPRIFGWRMEGQLPDGPGKRGRAQTEG